jgi:hypothetical protein
MWGASRFTALLAAIAISGMAGTFWWALETRSDMKAAAGNHGTSRALPPKFTGRVTRAKDERPGKLEPGRSDSDKPESGKPESGKFELMGRSERPLPASVGSAGRSEDNDTTDHSATLLANYPAGQASGSSLPSYAPRSPGFQGRSSQMPGLLLPGAQGSGAQGAGTQVAATSPQPQNYQSPGAAAPIQAAAGNRADMPLPALPPARPEPAPWQTTMSQPPPVLLPPPAVTPPPQPLENRKRQARSAIPAAPAAARAAKPQAQSYYMEQYLEQGQYHLRRRPCEPPNMPDVCFMPQADRQPVIVARP